MNRAVGAYNVAVSRHIAGSTKRELSVLHALTELLGQSGKGGDSPGPQQIIDATGLTREDVDAAVFALKRAGYIQLKELRGDDQLVAWRIRSIDNRHATKLIDES